VATSTPPSVSRGQDGREVVAVSRARPASGAPGDTSSWPRRTHASAC
jgi:hypothetical protein